MAAATKTQLTNDWTVEVRTADAGLARLRAEWDDLFARCAAATPFQSYAWLESWWRNYGGRGRLRLVLVRQAGKLVGAAPLLLRRGFAGGVLAPIGGALSDFTDVLLDDSVAADAARQMVGALLRRRDWRVVDFAETRPDSLVGRAVAAAWPGRHADLPASLCLELAATPVEDLVRDLPSHARKTVRRRLNQIGKLDLDVRGVRPVDVAEAVADLLRLHAAQWQGRAGNPAHLRPEFARHLTRAVEGMVESGQAALLEYRLAGRLMASNLVVVGPDLAGGYLFGADPRLRDHVDVTTLLISTTLPVAHRLGCATLSMLRGAEPYKYRWRPTESVNRRVLLARPGSPRALAYIAAARTRHAAVAAAKQRAPWLRAVRDRAKVAASRLRRGGPSGAEGRRGSS